MKDWMLLVTVTVTGHDAGTQWKVKADGVSYRAQSVPLSVT